MSYTKDELIPAPFDDGLEEIGRRYGIAGLSARFFESLRLHVEQTYPMGMAYDSALAHNQITASAATVGGEMALGLLPDQEFLTAYESAARYVSHLSRAGEGRAQHMFDHASQVFRTYGLPYAVASNEIVWAGDGATRQMVLEPVLRALQDPRVSGAKSEFDQARLALRNGTPDKLRDATHEAGNSVEATLHALLAAHHVTGPRSRTAAPIFNSLREAGVLPAALENVVLAAPVLRNVQGGHSQGATVIDADQRIAKAAVSAAAVAITALVSYLP